jgi:hypothetical protein
LSGKAQQAGKGCGITVLEGKKNIFAAAHKTASIVAPCAGESEAIVFDFKTYRRGAEGAEMTQRKSDLTVFALLCVSSASSAPLR